MMGRGGKCLRRVCPDVERVDEATGVEGLRGFQKNRPTDQQVRAFLSPPVAMSAYYLKQVVKDWSLATIYNGMFQFMVLQVICIGLVLALPQHAGHNPEHCSSIQTKRTGINRIYFRIHGGIVHL